MIALLAFARAIHMAALMVLFGSDLFSQILRRAGLPGGTPLATRVTAPLSLTALFGALIWLAALVLQLGENSVAMTFRLVLSSTFFGHVFILRIAVLLALTTASFSDRRAAVAARIVLGGIGIAALSLTGHAAASGPPFALRAFNDATHLLAASFWVGGLALLLPLVLNNRTIPSRIVPTLSAFSAWGMGAVAILVVAGTVNALMILWIDSSRWSEPYMTLLAVKLVLAALMISLALANRFSMLPGIRAGGADAQENLILSVVAELVLGVIIVAIVGLLGLLPYQR